MKLTLVILVLLLLQEMIVMAYIVGKGTIS
jgi:hypothetical protein